MSPPPGVAARVRPSEPTRPIVVIVPMPPTYRGGTEEYAYQLVQRYSEHADVRVLTTVVRRKDSASPLSTGSASISYLNAVERFERPVLSGREAWRSLRAAVENARVVQLHMPFPFVERRVARWARAAGVPLVLTYHMDAEFGDSLLARLITGAYRSISARPALSRGTLAISNSLGYARASPVLSRYLSKVRVIFQGIDGGRLRVQDPAAPTVLHPVDPSARKIVFIGRLVPYKGIPYLLEAVGGLRRSGAPVELFVAGKGPILEELQRRSAELGLGASVHFLGFVPDSALAGLYREADVIVSPSISLLESTPITLMEAMAVGTPVIGTTLPGTEETVPNDGVRGLLVPAKDAAALEVAIRGLIGRPRPTEVVSVRSWDDTARDYLRLFDELTGATGRP